MIKKVCILFFLLIDQVVIAQTETFYSADTSKFKLIRNRIKDQTFFIKLDSTNIRAYTDRANYEFAIRDWKSCMQDFSKVIELDPDFSYAYYKRASCKDRVKDYEGAIKDLTKAIGIKNKGADALSKELMYYDRGLILNRLKKFKDAEQDFLSALELKPNWTEALWGIGLVNEHQGHFDTAIDFYTKSAVADSANFKSYNNIASIYIRQKKYDLAIEYCEKSLRLFPKYSHSLVNLAEAKYMKGDRTGACDTFQKYILAGLPYEEKDMKKYCEGNK
jgi:tetratricopeptide (TPR) repeat protein